MDIEYVTRTYSRKHAERILSGKVSGDIIELVIKELNRFYTLGRYSVINPIKNVLAEVNKDGSC